MKRVKLILRRLLLSQEHGEGEVEEEGDMAEAGEEVHDNCGSSEGEPRTRLQQDGADQDVMPSTGRLTSTNISSSSMRKKCDFGQTVHPVRENCRPQSASRTIKRHKATIAQPEFKVVQPSKNTLFGIQEVRLPPEISHAPRTRGVLQLGPLIYEEYCEGAKPAQKNNLLAQLNHSMKTQTSFEMAHQLHSGELVEHDSCSSSLAGTRTPLARRAQVTPIGSGREVTSSLVSKGVASEDEAPSELNPECLYEILKALKGKPSSSISELEGRRLQQSQEQENKSEITGKAHSQLPCEINVPLRMSPSHLSRTATETHPSAPPPGQRSQHRPLNGEQKRSTMILLHAKSCTNNCQALSIPHEVRSKFVNKEKSFAVERSEHDGEEGLLITTTGVQTSKGPKLRGETGASKMSNLNFLTVKFDSKGLETLDLNVMSCISCSSIPHDLYLTDSTGHPIPEAKLKIIPYPCPCHPLEQLIKSRQTYSPLPPEELKELKRPESEVECCRGILAISEKNNKQCSKDFQSTEEISDSTAIIEKSLCTSQNISLNEAPHETPLRPEKSPPLEGIAFQPQGEYINSSPDKISVRSLAAIAGQGVFRTMKESPIQTIGPSGATTNTFFSYVPSEFEHKRIMKLGNESNGIKDGFQQSTNCLKNVDMTVKADNVTEKDNCSVTPDTYSKSAIRNFFLLDENRISEVYSPVDFTETHNIPSKKNLGTECSELPQSREAKLINTSSVIDVDIVSKIESNRLILKASRKSTRHIDNTNASISKSLFTAPNIGAISTPKVTSSTETSKEGNSPLHQPVTSVECKAPEIQMGTSVKQTPESNGVHLTGEAPERKEDLTKHSQSGKAQAGDELNDCGAVDEKQESRGLKEVIRILSQMRRPISRRGREGRKEVPRRCTKTSAEDQQKQTKLVQNSASNSQVQSLWLSQWTEKTFPSSKSFIHVSGEGSNLIFDCEDATNLSGPSIQLDVVDVQENVQLESEGKKEEEKVQQDALHTCVVPLSLLKNSSQNLNGNKPDSTSQTAHAPIVDVIQTHLRYAVARTAKTRETTRFRTPFSNFRSRRPTIVAVPEPNVSTFECVVCTDYLSPPVRQCVTGHGLCPSCLKESDLCPICRRNVPAEPNNALDSLVRTVLFPCKNASAGCKESYWIEERARHEARCPYRPRPCPFASKSHVMCGWSGLRTMIRGHMKRAHGHHGTVYAYRTFFPMEDFNLAAWVNRTYHVEIVFVEHEIFELHKVFDKRNTCLWGLLRHILARDTGSQFSYSIRFQPANMRPNVTFRNDAVSGSEDLDNAFAQGKRFNLHLDCFTKTPLDIFSVQLKVQPVDRNKWP